MRRAFTGPSSVGTTKQAKWIVQQMMAYPDAEIWHSGCAYFVDTLAARLAVLLERQLALFQPAAPHNDQMVASLIGHPGVVVMRCGRGDKDTDASAYRHRNEMMLKHADHLVAFVHHPEYYRSGEWMTINIAEQLGIQTSIEVIPQNGGQ